MKAADQGVTAPLNSPGRGCEDRDFQRIPLLPGKPKWSVYEVKVPANPRYGPNGGGGGGGFQMTGA